MQVIVALAEWVVIDEGVDTGHPEDNADDLVVGSPWHDVVCVAEVHDLRPVAPDQPLQLDPDAEHPTGRTSVVAEVVAHYPSVGARAETDGHTLLQVGPARFFVPGRVDARRVSGTVSLAYEPDFPYGRPAWSGIGPRPPQRRMCGVVRRMRRVPVYLAPPRPGSAEHGRFDGVRAGLGAPHDVPSALAQVVAQRPDGFALPLDRPGPDAGFTGDWGNPQAGGFWISQECLVHLEVHACSSPHG